MLPSISGLHDRALCRGQRSPISRQFEKVMKRVSCPWQHMNNTVDGEEALNPVRLIHSGALNCSSQSMPLWASVRCTAETHLRERRCAGASQYRSTVILQRCQPIVFTVSSLSVRKCADHFKWKQTFAASMKSTFPCLLWVPTWGQTEWLERKTSHFTAVHIQPTSTHVQSALPQGLLFVIKHLSAHNLTKLER